MSQIAIELIPDPEIGGFTARIPDIPAYGEGETEEEAIADLKEALIGYIEAFGLDDLLARLLQPISIRHLDWDLRRLQELSLTPAQERELDRRVAAYHEDGDPGEPWEDALREIEASRPLDTTLRV